jgi:hypothetical protein
MADMPRHRTDDALDVGLVHIGEAAGHSSDFHIWPGAGQVRSDGTPIPRLKPVPPVPRGGFFGFLDAGAYPVEFFSEDVGALFEALSDARRAPKYGNRRARPNRSRR